VGSQDVVPKTQLVDRRLDRADTGPGGKVKDDVRSGYGLGDPCHVRILGEIRQQPVRATRYRAGFTVDANDGVPSLQKRLGEVASDEATDASDHRPHRRHGNQAAPEE